jgi:hypothetical protein
LPAVGIAAGVFARDGLAGAPAFLVETDPLLRDLVRGARRGCGFPRDRRLVHSEHFRRGLVAGDVNNDAIDEFDDAPHHLGAVEETAQNGFALAQRFVGFRDDLAGDLPLALQLGDSRPEAFHLVRVCGFLGRRCAHRRT